MKRQFILAIGIVLILAACGNDPVTEAPSNDTNISQPANTETTSDNHSSDSETTVDEPETPSGETALITESYEIVDQTFILESLNTALTLPEVQGLTNSSLQENVNAIIAEAANEITDTLDGTNPVTITYELGMQSPTLLSILFKAEMQIEEGTIEFWNPVSISIISAARVSTETLYDNNTPTAVSDFNQLFSQMALEAGFEFEKPEPWMSFYFTDNALVYFFKENDFSEHYIEIHMPLEASASAINPLLLP
ncbi:hypothetical protein KHM83_12095 [Fusibacter paucivorans]|uniref:DUF3298 domain-containing protein n=1 Tax=Fusibacter paucivorans TaxID=76009 RepID=A0ABS5PS71_9FIRM|nr:hypothetical protein [Fusibacter paucivorans]MBS7527416.1 hypothetical protein [Fusibacter paucivorans]